METIRTSSLRVGNITSSEVYKIVPCGKRDMTKAELDARPKTGKGSKTTLADNPETLSEGGLTYIADKKLERKLGRPLNDDCSARPLIWGKFLERRVFDLLGFEYECCSDITIGHPFIESWAGSPDGVSIDAVVDVKCPWTLKSFCKLVDAKNIQELRETHDDGEKYFFQLVSNAILTLKDYAELIVYVPYKSELLEIKQSAGSADNLNEVAWINWSDDDKLPYLVDGGEYKNLNIIRFEVSQSDKDFLTHRVELAERILKG